MPPGATSVISSACAAIAPQINAATAMTVARKYVMARHCRPYGVVPQAAVGRVACAEQRAFFGASRRRGLGRGVAGIERQGNIAQRDEADRHIALLAFHDMHLSECLATEVE